MANDPELPRNLAAEWQKAGLSAELYKKVLVALEAAGMKVAQAHEDVATVLNKIKNSSSNFGALLEKQVQYSNEFLGSSKEVNAVLAGREVLEKEFQKLLENGVEEAGYLAEEQLALFQNQAEALGYSGNAARYYARMIAEGKDVTGEEVKANLEILDAKEKQLDFVKKSLDLQNKTKQRVEEIRKSHDRIKDSLKQELMFAKELSKDSRLMGALIAQQLASNIGKAVTKMNELRETGMQAGEAIRMMRENFSLMSVMGLSKVEGVSKELVAQFGTMNAMTKEQRHAIGEMAYNFGLAEKEAVDLTLAVSRLPGESLDTAKNFSKTAENVGKMKGILPSQIMKEMAKNTANIAIYSKGGAAGFAAATAEAKKMGLEIGNVLSAAEKTLDFESSLTNQMEASALIGKEINLDALRKAALEGDTTAIMREQTKVMQSVGDIDKLNTLQKRKLAETMGMTVEELQKFNTEQQFNTKYFGENASALDNVIGLSMKYGGAIGGIIKDYGLIILAGAQYIAQLGTTRALKSVNATLTAQESAANTLNTTSIGLNTQSKRLNSVQMQVYNVMRAQGISASVAYTAAKGIETAAENVNTGSKQRGIVATIAMNAVNLVRNGVIAAGNLIMSAATGIMSLFSASTVATGTAAGFAAGPLLALGAAVLMVGAGIGVAAYGISLLVQQLGLIPYENLLALPMAFMGIGAGLYMMAAAGAMALPAITSLIALSASVVPLLALGAAVGGIVGGLAAGGGGGGKGGEVTLKDVNNSIKALGNQKIQLVLDNKVIGEIAAKVREVLPGSV